MSSKTHTYYMTVIAIMVLFILTSWNPVTALDPKDRVSDSEINYIRELAADTWACIDFFTNEQTGLPYDNNFLPDTTNTTNIALYLVSTVAAQQLDLLSSAQAKARINKVLNSLKRYPHFKGFFKNHLNVTGPTEETSGINAVSDFNKLPAALLIVRQAFPDIKLASRLFERIDWSWLWDRNTQQLRQGYDISDGETYFWGNGWLASDVHIAVFLGVATGHMPLQAYYKMEKNKATHYGLEFYRPAWEFAGLFMHAMGGLFMDEMAAPMGWSTANYAYAQMQYAQEKKYPVWGWSACHRPGQGYTVNGLLSQAVVTPHASALVISYYPKKVIANLKALEKMGCRTPYELDGEQYAFGFWDAINLTTKEVSNHYYPGLDQAMLFIALANFLQPGCIQQLYMNDPVVGYGMKVLGFSESNDMSRLEEYRDRDQAPLPILPEIDNRQKTMVIDEFRQARVNQLGFKRYLEISNAPKDVARERNKLAWGKGLIWEVTYNLNGHDKANLILKEELEGLDARSFNAIAFDCKSDSSNNRPIDLRLRVTDAYNSRVIGFVSEVNEKWRKVIFPYELFRGILVDLSNLKTIEISLERNPTEFNEKKLAVLKGALSINNIKLVKLDKITYRNAVQTYLNAEKIKWKNNGQLTGLDRLSGWQTYQDADARISLSADKQKKSNLQIEYQLTEKGRWVACEKAFGVNLPDSFNISFEVKGEGDNTDLELKLITPTGAVFGKTLRKHTALKKWTKVELNKEQLRYLWGGSPDDKLNQVKTFGLAVSGPTKLKGRMYLRDFVITKQ